VKEELIQNVSKNVYRRFPAVKGKRPKVRVQQSQSGKQTNTNKTYSLTYHNTVETANRKRMPYWVRVVVDEKGKVLKTTTSR
jgi:hypothetical protein